MLHTLLLLATLTADAKAFTLTVHVGPMHSDKGAVNCRIYASGDGFPTKPTHLAQQKATVEGKTATCTFTKLPPGTYAVSAFHDENGNGKLDTNFIGMPSEGVAMSNNAKGHMGPPSWDDAKFELKADATIELALVY